MAKRLKLKLSKLLQSCRSKHPSSLPANPVPSFLRLSQVNPNPITLHSPSRLPPILHASPVKSHRSSLKRHVSTAITTIGCGIRSASRSTTTQHLSDPEFNESPPPPTTPLFHWEKQDRWHVIAKSTDFSDEAHIPRQKVYTSEDDVDQFPPLRPSNAGNKFRRRKKKKKIKSKIRISTSSVDSEFFGDDGVNITDEEETETLVSSRFGNISEAAPPPFTAMKRKKKKKKKKTTERSRRSITSPESDSPARLSLFIQRLIPCTVEGKVRESFAVVKKSEDPLEDFKRSMMEMILEKQMYEETDLEQLLQCFLTLNSREHHGIIVKAFSEIWEALFTGSSRRSSTSSMSSEIRKIK